MLQRSRCSRSNLSVAPVPEYPASVRTMAEEDLHTCALAHSSRPPIGANIMPTAKKRGRTVLGVRIGLTPSAPTSSLPALSDAIQTYCQAFNLCCRKAVSTSSQKRGQEGGAHVVNGVGRMGGNHTWGPPALDFLVAFLVRILRIDRVRMGDLCRRHDGISVQAIFEYDV